jgi:ribonuclease HI
MYKFTITDNKLNKKTSSNKKEDCEEKKYIYQLYFDGASRGNPGLSGAGAVLFKCYHEEKTQIFEVTRFVGDEHTNNQAEYCGLIIGLKECLKRGFRKITVYGDSEVIIKQMNDEYNVNSDKLIPLYETAKKIENKMELVSFQHIKRVFNSEADSLANKAIDDYLKN